MTSVGNEAINNVGVVFTNLPPSDDNSTTAKKKAVMVTEMFKGLEKVVPQKSFLFGLSTMTQ